jgi:hypothetical protein
VGVNPSSGFWVPETIIEKDPRPLEGLHSVQFKANPATLPPDFLSLPSNQLQSVLTEGYIRPYYSGWHRPVSAAEPIRIAGLEFTALPQSLGLGFIGPPTRITVSLPSDRPQFIVQNVLDLGLLQHILILGQVTNGGVVAQPTGTRVDIVRDLPVRVVERRGRGMEMQSCTVCMSEFEVGENIKALPCCKFHLVHEFHVTCIDHWLSRSQLCPLCKANVPDTFLRARQLSS